MVFTMSTRDIEAAIEHGNTGLWYGRLTEFPGTHGRARDREVLLKDLQEELEYHLRWLRRHQEPVPQLSNPAIRVVEEVEGVSELGESGGEVAFFEFDRQTVDEKCFGILKRYMVHNREDLVNTVVDLDRKTLSKTPEGKQRSIFDILAHVCNAEEFYLSRLGEEADQLYQMNLGMEMSEADELPILERLGVIRTACIRTLKQLLPEKKEGEFTRIDYTTYPSERWSLYKVLRRFLEHEREHIYNIREYLGLAPRSFEL